MNRLTVNLYTLIIIFFLSACGGGGDGGTTPSPANVAPTADAGTDQTVNEETTVTLNGSGTDTDGTIAGYQWEHTSGTMVTIADATSASTTFIAPTLVATEVLTFTLTVTDDDGDSSSDIVDITINPVNVTPTVDAGDNQEVFDLTFVASTGTFDSTTVTLTGSSSDSDGTVDVIQWTQTAGTTVDLDFPNDEEVSFTAPELSAIETLTFQLSVTDNEGAESTDTINIVVNKIDSDSDGILDVDDNCAYVANEEQADGDTNGIGDVCDQPMNLGGGATPWGAATWEQQ